MKSLTDQLAAYASYHRDRRNVATHFVGIPMIVLAIVALLGRPVLGVVLGLPVTPASLLLLGATAFYVRLDRRFGALMFGVTLPFVVLGAEIATLGTAAWLGTGIGLFVVGWAFQLVGHVFEGRKPAFVDDLVGLLVGPLFLVVEVCFALGLCRPLHDEIRVRLA